MLHPERWSVYVMLMVVCAHSSTDTSLEAGDHEADKSSSPAECHAWPPPCRHLCQTSDSGHKCSCHAGYTLHADQSRCIPDEWMKGPYLIYSQDRHISVKSLGDPYSTPDEIVNKQDADIRIGTFDVEVSTLSVYYTSTCPGFSPRNRNTTIIKVSDLEGKNDTEFITRGLTRITSIAVDWIGRVLYIGDEGLHQIIACSISGRHCSTVKTVRDPASVAVNPVDRKLYWSDCSSPHSQLYVSNMDGSDMEMILQLENEGCIEELQIDMLQDTLYWINRGMLFNKINSMRLKTKNINEISRDSNALAVYADEIFYTLTSTYEHEHYKERMTNIYAENKFDIKALMDEETHDRMEEAQRGILGVPARISIVHKVQQPQEQNPCADSACSHICLLKSGARTTCSCPAGWTLSEDDVTCRANWTTPSILVVKEKRIVRVVPDLVGSNELDVIFEASEIVTALAYHWSMETIYYSTKESKNTGNSAQIYSLQLNSVNAEQKVLFKEESSVLDMETDWTSGNLYWINSDTRDIKVGKLDGSFKISLMQNINKTGVVEKPTALALLPSQRKLYYSDCGLHPHIGECDLAGMDCVTKRIDVNAGCASDLFLKTSTDKHRWLYWADNENHKIMKSDLSQSSTVMLRGVHVPISIVASGDRIFWTGGYESGIRYAAEHVNSEHVNVKTIHFGIDGFERMIYFADFVQQPKETNECGNGNGRCNHGVCIPNQAGHQCHESDKATTVYSVETSETTKRHITTVTTSVGSATEEPSSHAAHISSSATAPKTSKIKNVNTKKQCNCLNGGECDVEAGGICRCAAEYHGARCELLKKPVEPLPPQRSDQLTAGDTQTIMYAALGIISVAVIIALIIVTVCFRTRCRIARKRAEDGGAKTLGTPLYENPSAGKNIHKFSIPRPKLAQENDFC